MQHADLEIPSIYVDSGAVLIKDNGDVCFNPENTFTLFRGGRGRAGSWTMVAVAVMMSLQKPMDIMVLRSTKSKIKESVWKLIENTAKRLGVQDSFYVTQTYIATVNGSRFFYDYMHNNEHGIRSTEDVELTLGEECQDWQKLSIQALKPTVLRDDNSQFVGCLNPQFDDDPIETEMMADTDCLTVNASILDNPFAPDKLLREYVKQMMYDPETGEHIWHGGYRIVSNEIIFAGKCVREYINAKEYTGTRYYGLDWGFGGHPTAFVEIGVDGDDILVLDAMFWDDKGKGKLDTSIIKKDLEERHKINPILNEVWCDPATPEPARIVDKHFEQYRVRFRGRWGKDGVEGGIQYLRAHRRIVFNTDTRLDQFWKETKKYRRKVDKKTNTVTVDIVKENDHGWDATRYALHRLIKKGVME